MAINVIGLVDVLGIPEVWRSTDGTRQPCPAGGFYEPIRNLVSADVEVYRNPMVRRIRGDATAAAVMVAGSAAFLAGAFMPVSRVYVEGDPQRKLAILLADPGQWSAQQMLLAAGTAALPVGVVMLARHWDKGRIGTVGTLGGEAACPRRRACLGRGELVCSWVM